ncbi:MAG TPA: hypothetical protein VGM10_20030 [Actinocrinis sp.]|jgi:seryl-tRNA synthetase
MPTTPVTPIRSADPGDARPLPTAVPGVYIYTEAFESVIAGLRRAIAGLAADEPFLKLALPPVISRAAIERAGYVKSFPNLLGTVHSFAGTEAEWRELAPHAVEGGAWHAQQTISDLVLPPAACYSTYAALEGQALDAPARFAVEAPCFRQEATGETGRLRTFRMLELVTAGTEEHCVEWRGRWLERVADWLAALSLKPAVEVADDPFFGRGGPVYQAAQRAKQLKFELRVAVAPGVVQAVASANFHEDHFGRVYGFTVGGAAGRTACTAFGLERLALALIAEHGSRPDQWPDNIPR